MNTIKAFLFANIPVSIVHFILVVLAKANGWSDLLRFIGQPGCWICKCLGAAWGGPIWWAFMVLNSLVWGGAIALVVALLRKK